MTNLITLAGNGARFSIEGFDLPKPLILVKGIPMIFRAVDSLPIADKYVFVCKSDHIQACTAEIGILNSTIDIDDEILISSCDYGLKWNNKFYNKLTSDIIVWSTIHNKSFSSNPNSYSWLSVDSSGNLLKTYVKQKTFKNSYNEHAIVGTFYFKKAKYFLEGLEQIYKNNITSNGEFYIDNIFNSITDLDVKIFDVDEYYCWGTPKDLKDYEN